MTTFSKKLLTFFDQHKRDLPWRRDPTPYETWVSEIMLQQTRVEAVIPYYLRFLEELPTVKDLAEVDEQRLLKLWEGLGYYSRAKNLKKGAQVIMEQWNGKIPDHYEDLLKIPGIGPYTAGAVASMAFGQVVPAVDGNVNRVIARVTAYGEDPMKAAGKRYIFSETEKRMSRERPGDFNQAMMDLGATVCLPNGAPLCESCPVADECLAHERGEELLYPKKREKKPRRVEEKTVFLLEEENYIAFRRRPKKGLLAGLYELPNVEGHLDQEEAVEALRGMGFDPIQIQKSIDYRHIFSHVEWDMISYRVKLPLAEAVREGGQFLWADERTFEETVALAGAFAPFYKELGYGRGKG